ncbi:MAG: GYF domain-containing protein [Verrucomicrobiota bacterium]
MSEQYYVYLSEQTAGPFTLEQLAKLHGAGTVTDDTLFSAPGAVEWLPLKTIRPLFPSPEAPPATQPVAAVVAPAEHAPKPPSPRRKAYSGDWICQSCNHIDRSSNTQSGISVLSVLLWLGGLGLTVIIFPVGLFVLGVAVLHSVARHFSKRQVCSCCKSTQIIPADSPAGRQQVDLEPGLSPSAIGWIIILSALALLYFVVKSQ